MLEGRVAGVSNDEGTKDRADTSSGSGDSNGGSSGTDELGSGVNVFLDRGSGQGSAGLLRELHFKLKKTSQLKDNIFTWLAHIADTAGLWNWAMTFLEQVRRAMGYIL